MTEHVMLVLHVCHEVSGWPNKRAWEQIVDIWPILLEFGPINDLLLFVTGGRWCRSLAKVAKQVKIEKSKLFFVIPILGDPGATSRDDAILSGERHSWRESLFQGLKCMVAHPYHSILPHLNWNVCDISLSNEISLLIYLLISSLIWNRNWIFISFVILNAFAKSY